MVSLFSRRPEDPKLLRGTQNPPPVFPREEVTFIDVYISGASDLLFVMFMNNSAGLPKIIVEVNGGLFGRIDLIRRHCNPHTEVPQDSKLGHLEK